MAAIELYSTPLLSEAAAYYRAENANDSSSNANNLTLVNSPSFSPAKFNNGFDFELSSSQYGYKTDTASLSITGDISVVAYLKLEQLPSAVPEMFTICSKWDYTDNKRNYYFSVNASNKLEFAYSDDGTFAGHVTRASCDTAFGAGDVGNLRLCIVTVDVSAKTFTFDIDNSSKTYTKDNDNATSIADSDVPFCVGAYGHGLGGLSFFDGIIDELALFPRVLTTTEKSNIYTGEWPVGGVFIPSKMMVGVGI